MKKKATTIKSWIGQKVRIKKEYIKVELVLDDDASTFDDDGNVIEEVFRVDAYIDCNNGLNGLVDNPNDTIFDVKMDIYGIDLFNHRRDGLIVGDVKATHQLIIEVVEGGNKIGYPYLWDSKYFEVVVPVTTTTTEWIHSHELPSNETKSLFKETN
jgi:hypothetical protein